MRVGTQTDTDIQYVFESFAEFVQYNQERVAAEVNKSIRTRNRAGDGVWHGSVKSVSEACELAAKGLPKDGVDALALASVKAKGMVQEIRTPQYVNCMDTAGAYVDMGRFVTGEPECMVDYALQEDTAVQTVIPIVVNMAVVGGVRHEEIAKRGRAIVALIDAVQATGRSVELWADMSSNGCDRGSFNGSDYMARFSIPLKRADQPTDAGMLMYAFTHASFFRVLGFNTRHTLPARWQRALDVGGGYGVTVRGAKSVERDYPQGSVYISALRYGENHDETVREALRELGLL
ncbi:hypothetical protein SEA_ROSE5_129 [Mycobacterium phage Rose5]|nr:hypothetical protein SEA_ROSE5_129 [Mycobacterium phage Rose5]